MRMFNHMRLQFTVLILGCGLSIAGTNSMFFDSASWTGKVYIAAIGDSLVAGGGTIGTGTQAFPISVSNASGGNFKVVNYAVGGSRWTNMPGLLAGVWVDSPRWVFVHCGRNDLLQCFIAEQVYPCYWPTIESNMNWIMASCITNNAKLAVGEVLPAYTNYTEWATPGIHLLNTAYSNWCSTNAMSYFIAQHDDFGVLNPDTGALDWLNPIYMNNPPTDPLHINQAGMDMWGPMFVQRLGGYFPEKNSRNIGTLRVRSIIGE
jgi:lysophospholipase L1-like esterase